MGIIFLASSMPSSQIPNIGSLDLPVKKGAHFTGYALLALGLLRGVQNDRPRNLFLILLACGLYAISDEYHQSYISGRNSSLIDVGIDTLGSTFALILYLRLAPLRRLVHK
jgi:VanZ family protein